jgi:hypothetical protein
VRPAWLVAGLTVASFGLYAFYWFFSTWRELRAELSDDSMHPVWHALSTAAPIYGLFRVHAHMRLTRAVAVSRGLRVPLSPGSCVTAWLIVTWLGNATSRVSLRSVGYGPWVGFGIDLAIAAITAAVLVGHAAFVWERG